MAYEKDPDELGALWARTSAKGAEFMTGEIAGVGDVVLFKAKVTDRGPTWRVFKSKPREARPTEDAPSPAPAPRRAYRGQETPPPPSRSAPREDDDFDRVSDERVYEDEEFRF